jgi:predicted glycosyltransferase
MPRSAGRAGAVKPRVLFYVQHLLGIGHLVRAARIATALAGRGFDVSLVMGGQVVPELSACGVSVFELPPVKAGPSGFSELVREDGRAADEAFKAERRDRLLGVFAQVRPDVLLIEAFPFGRRQMRFELLPLLDLAHATRPRPIVVSSIRDILQERVPKRAEEALSIVKHRFDHVIVHGDPALIRLEASFPRAREIEDRISYSGIVAPELAAEDPSGGDFDVIVSGGGGAVGYRLFVAAIEAKPLTRLESARWVVSTGPNLDRQQARELERIAAARNVSLARYLPDLATRLSRAQLSISQAGYTVADILTAGCRCVLCPYAVGGETEQSLRASVLARRGLAAVVREDEVSPETMAAAVEKALRLGPADRSAIDLDGARGTGRILHGLLEARTPAKA